MNSTRASLANNVIAPSGELFAERIEAANSTRLGACVYEGPIWINDALYFSAFTSGPEFHSRIQKLDATGLTTFIEDSGSNGLAVNAQGDLVAATHKYKGLATFNLVTKKCRIITKKYNDDVFNSPNDLIVAKDGAIYFTDPDFQKSAAPGGQKTTGVYRIGTDGLVTLIDDSIKNPNGIALSPAEDFLYVTGGGNQGILRAYPIINGNPNAGKDIITGLKVPDGMAVDFSGHLYVAEHTEKHIRVFTPEGNHIASINVEVTNVTFGGEQGTTLFITGVGAVWKIGLAAAVD